MGKGAVIFREAKKRKWGREKSGKEWKGVGRSSTGLVGIWTSEAVPSVKR